MRGRRPRHIPGCAKEVHSGIEHGLIRLASALLCLCEGNVSKGELWASGTRVVNQDIDRAKALDRFGDDLSTNFRVSTVTCHGYHVVPVKALVAKGVDEVIEFFDVTSGQHDASTFAQ